MDIQLLTIGGVAMPAPSEYKVTYSDFDNFDSGRSENGEMYRNRVRANVAKIEAKWTNLKAAEVTKIMNAITPDEFTVNYFFGSLKNATMYAGDKSCDLASMEANGETRWNVSFNLIEY